MVDDKGLQTPAEAIATLTANLDAMRRERDGLVSYIDPQGNPELISRIIMSSIENSVRAETAEAEVARLTACVGELEKAVAFWKERAKLAESETPLGRKIADMEAARALLPAKKEG